MYLSASHRGASPPLGPSVVLGGSCNGPVAMVAIECNVSLPETCPTFVECQGLPWKGSPSTGYTTVREKERRSSSNCAV